MRVSTLLDDMLCSAVIKLKMLDVSLASRCGSAKLSGRSIDTAAFERRASKLLNRNKDRFRDFSPAVTSRPSKMSPGLNTPKGEDWPTMTPIKSGALSERDGRVGLIESSTKNLLFSFSSYFHLILNHSIMLVDPRPSTRNAR